MAEQTCGRMVFQDDSRIRCVLPVGHEWPCSGPSPERRLLVEPYMRERTIREVDPNYKMISDGSGLFVCVPTWVADRLEQVGLDG